MVFELYSYLVLTFNQSVHSVNEKLPSGQLSNVPWRRAGVKYTNNEAYFDVIEEIDAIVDKSGSIVSAEIQGYVSICIRFQSYQTLIFCVINRLIVALN